MYCVYLTIYSGNKLPPFYIGYSSVKKVERGYHGTVKSKEYMGIWKEELSENPHLFKTTILTTHDSREEAKEKEEYFQRYFRVHRNPMYVNRCISNRMFYNKGHQHTEESRRKISEANRGKEFSEDRKLNISNAKKGVPVTEEHKRKISETLTGRKASDESRRKQSEARRGKSRDMDFSYMRRRVTDGTNIFSSMKEAAAYHGVRNETISRRVSRGFEQWAYYNENK